MNDQLTLELPGDDVIAQAEISKCGAYRYTLWRNWQTPMLGCVTWIMLNPSTADGETDDATIRKCIGFSMRWGFSGIRVVNLFGFRATDSGELVAQSDPVGPHNDHAINTALGLARMEDTPNVVAWGRNNKHPEVRHRGEFVAQSAEYESISLVCLGTNQDGSPKHPLMLPYATPLEAWP